jgi:predicted AAA+ superfamily ATPase
MGGPHPTSETSPSIGFRRALTEALAQSLSGTLPGGTPRQDRGRTRFPGKATAVIGMRRAGKTTFLHQLRQEAWKAGMPRERLPFINFEDERLVGLQAQDLSLLLEEYHRRHPETRGAAPVLWCFDEIQVVPGWERFVRRILDTEKVEVLLSGSSAALLSREVATSMRGRAWEVLLHPFSLAETLAHAGHPVPRDPSFLSAPERSALERAFLDYLSIGGFPEAQGLDPGSRFQLLRDYVDVTILRDVMERHGVGNLTALRWLVRHLLSNAAGTFSIQKFYDALRSQGVSASKDTLHQMLSYLDDCFLIRTVQVDSESERRRMVHPRKSYPVDPGLIPLFDRSGRSNLGHALETAVFLELERRRLDIAYVRTQGGFEVDFLTRDATGTQELIQVCADATAAGTGLREVRALQEAGVRYPGAARRLLTLTRDRLPADLPPGVVGQPAYEWMLSEGP